MSKLSDKKLRYFRNLNGAINSNPRGAHIDKDLVYDNYVRAKKGNPESEYLCYSDATTIKDIKDPTEVEVKKGQLLEKAVKNTFGSLDKIKEAERYRKPAAFLTFTGPDNVFEENDKKTAVYLAEVDSKEGGIPVNFKLEGFIAGDIESVESFGDEVVDGAADLVGDGVEVLTNPNGVASLEIEFAADKQEDGKLTASIEGAHRWVGEDVGEEINIVVDTKASIYIMSTDPADGEVDVAVDTAIDITFSENISDNSGGEAVLNDIIMLEGEGNPVIESFTITNAVLNLVITGNLANGETYTVTIPAEGSVIATAKTLKENYSFSFTTIAAE